MFFSIFSFLTVCSSCVCQMNKKNWSMCKCNPIKKKPMKTMCFFFAQCVRVTTKHYWHRRHTQKKNRLQFELSMLCCLYFTFVHDRTQYTRNNNNNNWITELPSLKPPPKKTKWTIFKKQHRLMIQMQCRWCNLKRCHQFYIHTQPPFH